MSVKNNFHPVSGTESKIMNAGYNEGWVYFATDSKKIYLDMDGREKISMGGNSSIFYGIKELPEAPDESQKEFTFLITEIEGNENNYFNIPNENDLILNKDGCFYRVRSTEGEGINTIIFTEKLTIAGSGNNSNGNSNVGDMKLETLTDQTVITLRNYEYSIGFKATAWDYDNIPTGDGTYKLVVNGTEVEKGNVKQNKEIYIPVHNYLNQTTNTVTVQVSMDVGGAVPAVRSKTFNITVTEMNLTWDYDYTDQSAINYVDKIFKTSYSISGTGIEKTAWLQIDNLPPFSLGTTTSSSTQYLILTPDQIKAYNLTHGSHIFKMWATTEVNGTNSTPPIYKNIAFVGYNEDGSVNSMPIINCGLFNTNLIQYNTVYIPINIYSSTNIASNATVILFEGGIEKDRWENVENLKEYIWSYTPTSSGIQSLKIQCGTTDVVFNVNIAKLDIDKEEVEDYIFKFKASDFASNTAVQNWNSNGVNATFNNFDWINGGLNTEKDEAGNSRQYVAIKAGSTMDINYNLWNQNAPVDGKVLKVIFKATNCRDYDARILSCKKDKKIIKEDDIEQLFFIENKTTIQYSEHLELNSENNTITLRETKDIVFDMTDKDTRETLDLKYVLMEDNKIYKCHIAETENSTKENPEYYAGWFLMEVVDSFDGIVLNAQNAMVNTSNRSLDTQYCEDSYIELEMSITKYDSKKIKNYIKFWIDGIPSGYAIYSSSDIFNNPKDCKITIGSRDCDVYIYMIKLYERELTTEEHLTNFIVDAPNAEEMIARYKRNDILDPDRKIIDPILLAKANPDCLVHVYEIPRMTIKKKDPVSGCKYSQYHNSDSPILRADNVMIKVQGTSSERYVDAAANIDTDFNYTDTADIYPPSGLIDTATGKRIEGWKMSENAIPIEFTCTKVNVASCENANNAMNQEWYNMFQPYKSVLRCKNPKARDTMQFTNGVMFMIDHQKKFDTSAGAETKNNNVFGELGEAYWNNPYPRMYSLAQMGNSKDNVHVFHDEENDYECCIEVKDNQELQQKMISDIYNYEDIGADEDYFEFRFPEDSTNQNHINGWNRLVRWMSHSNPQPKYEKHIVKSANDFKLISINIKNYKEIPVYVLNESKDGYIRVLEYNPSIEEYYTETVNLYGYTNLPLPEYELSYDLMPEHYKEYYSKTGDTYTKVDMSSISNPSGEGLYEKVKTSFGNYTFRGYRCEEQINPETNELWQKNYTPLVKGLSTSEYNGEFTHDTYQYRMAKMLNECEHYLVMDSVLYHYLFIERHSMIDNVAKNTFWSTEDCKHWNLIKDYDNDTSDGNDNNGKLTIPYGMEALDKIKNTTNVFNANNSVWFNFIYGLHDICQKFYVELSNKKVIFEGRELSLWNHKDYLWFFDRWQKMIPERCWVEDYYRKYFRPYEIYGITMFNDMMQGGQKKHQRKQYETYQDIYISSKYINNETNRLYFRPTGTGLLDFTIPVQTYSDCYVYMDIGSAHSHKRIKRNTELRLPIPAEDLGNATMDLRPANIFTIIGEEDGPGQLNAISPDQIEINTGTKLRKIVFGSNLAENAPSYNKGTSLQTLTIDNPLLEELYVANIGSVECDLDLSKSPNLLLLDAEKSGFTDVIIADKAPVTSIKLERPVSLTLSNLSELENLNIAQVQNIQSIRFDNIDNDNISSKDIIQDIIENDFDPNSGLRYTLKNINWTLNNSDDIQDNNKIAILEYLLTEPNRPNQNADTQKDEPTTTSLTGVITITADAYNGDNAFEIYNRYINKDTYPLVDLIFQGDQAKLYNVNIFDGNKNIYWTRKIIPNQTITKDFLNEGPYGTFNMEGIYKSDTESTDYEFANKWFVYLNSDFSDASPRVIDDLLECGIISQDVYIVPIFTENTRKYTLRFYGENHEEPFATLENILYGESYIDFVPKEIPYKEAEKDDNEKAGYDFKGYSLIQNSDIIVSNEFKVSSNQDFFAVFKHHDDLTEIVHNEWFQYDDINGLQPADNKILKGKVTIPSVLNGKDIVKLGNFQNSKITHLLCAPNSKLTTIQASAFEENTYLNYFDFSQNTVTKIENNAFRSCTGLDPNLFNLSSNLEVVGAHAFNGAFQGVSLENNKKIIIPASIYKVGRRAFNNLSIKSGGTLQIGEITESGERIYSKLDLSYNIEDKGNEAPFKQNSSSQFAKIIFYSKNYDSFEQLINNEMFLYQCFIAETIESLPSIKAITGIVDDVTFNEAKAKYDTIYTIEKYNDEKVSDYIFSEVDSYDENIDYYYYGKDFKEVKIVQAIDYDLESQKHTLFVIDKDSKLPNVKFIRPTVITINDNREEVEEIGYNSDYIWYYYDIDESLNDEFLIKGYTFTIEREGE